MIRSIQNYAELTSVMEPSSDYAECMLKYTDTEYTYIIVQIRRVNFGDRWEFYAFSDSYSASTGNFGFFGPTTMSANNGLSGWIFLPN